MTAKTASINGVTRLRSFEIDITKFKNVGGIMCASAKASTLGLQPGEWPDNFRIDGPIGTWALLCAVVIACTSSGVQADDRRNDRAARRHVQHNYIIERQQAYQVQGVPTQRLIIGRREIDVYPNGLRFEKNNVVGFGR